MLARMQTPLKHAKWLPTLLLSASFALGAVGCDPGTSGGEASDGGSAVIHMLGGGEIHIKFRPDVAPNHVANFKRLAEAGFYDGATFHRVIPNFMIQGGDPNTKDSDPTNDGVGGPGYTIKAEFNAVSHTRGIVSMARKKSADSAGSQFFIMLADANEEGTPWTSILDHKYTVFGEVVSGMDAVDKIATAKTDRSDRPLINQVIDKVVIE